MNEAKAKEVAQKLREQDHEVSIEELNDWRGWGKGLEHTGQYKLSIWPTSLDNKEIKTLIGIAEMYDCEVSYEEVHYEGGYFDIRSKT